MTDPFDNPALVWTANQIMQGKTEYREVCRCLLDCGADPNARSPEGYTALMYAASGDLETAEMLIDAGADVNATDAKGRGMVEFATTLAKKEDRRIVRLLRGALGKVDTDSADSEASNHDSADKPPKHFFEQQFGDRELQGVVLSRDAFDCKVADHQLFLESNRERGFSWQRMILVSPEDEVQYLEMSGLPNDHVQGNFRRVTVNAFELHGLDLRLTTWSHGRLEACKLRNCVLTSSVAINGTTAECKFYECDLSGSDWTQRVMLDNLFETCVLVGFDLERARIENSEYTDCEMRRVSFEGATISGTTFKECDLANSKLKGAVFEKCTFINAKVPLNNVDLSQATFRECNFLGKLPASESRGE